MALSTQPPMPMEEDDEELEEVPAQEKAQDPFRNAKIIRKFGNQMIPGRVEEIEQGKVSKERLYRIRYADGDVEHYTAAMIREFRDTEDDAVKKRPAAAMAAVETTPEPVAKRPAAAPAEEEAEEEVDEEDEDEEEEEEE